MKYVINKEPYASRVSKLFNEESNRIVSDDGVLLFTWEEVYNIAKASGLRSNKKRHLIKRFRLVMKSVFKEMLDAYGKKG